jgi:hypothetical protein
MPGAPAVAVPNDASGGGNSGGSGGGAGAASKLVRGSAAAADDDSPESLMRRARELREEADRIRSGVESRRREKREKAARDEDRWLREVLVLCASPSQEEGVPVTEVLCTAQQAAERLVRGRYSPEQVYRMFERLCQQSNVSGRDALGTNERLRVLVDAAGILDCLEDGGDGYSDDRGGPSSKTRHARWRSVPGRVEHELYKKLFAREWGVDRPLPGMTPSAASPSLAGRSRDDEKQ